MHAEHSQRPPGLAAVSYAACRMRIVVIILNHDHVWGARKHLRGNRPLRAMACLSGTAFGALIRRRTRSLFVFTACKLAPAAVAAACHMGSESLFQSHACACHHLVQTCKDHPPPHDRTSPHDVPCSIKLVLAWDACAKAFASGRRKKPYTWQNQRQRVIHHAFDQGAFTCRQLARGIAVALCGQR